MRSLKSSGFQKYFKRLPPEIQEKARKAFKLWLENPFHPSLRFKCIDREENVWSIRIDRNYRALAYKEEELFLWFWIGPHKEYERKL
ncbi:hypothetical protein [Thermosulfurimonas sp.]|uniref:type II toxin-antitoxin system RelE family toxin n=1 Tax=Thermosulfurimonas sp. TaxID=2080236 RepID=UPI0025DF81B9|nr:hypothetical protein [Thermosulfurimonas sp.]